MKGGTPGFYSTLDLQLWWTQQWGEPPYVLHVHTMTHIKGISQYQTAEQTVWWGHEAASTHSIMPVLGSVEVCLPVWVCWREEGRRGAIRDGVSDSGRTSGFPFVWGFLIKPKLCLKSYMSGGWVIKKKQTEKTPVGYTIVCYDKTRYFIIKVRMLLYWAKWTAILCVKIKSHDSLPAVNTTFWKVTSCWFQFLSISVCRRKFSFAHVIVIQGIVNCCKWTWTCWRYFTSHPRDRISPLWRC